MDPSVCKVGGSMSISKDDIWFFLMSLHNLSCAWVISNPTNRNKSNMIFNEKDV